MVVEVVRVPLRQQPGLLPVLLLLLLLLQQQLHLLLLLLQLESEALVFVPHHLHVRQLRARPPRTTTAGPPTLGLVWASTRGVRKCAVP